MFTTDVFTLTAHLNEKVENSCGQQGKVFEKHFIFINCFFRLEYNCLGYFFLRICLNVHKFVQSYTNLENCPLIFYKSCGKVIPLGVLWPLFKYENCFARVLFLKARWLTMTTKVCSKFSGKVSAPAKSRQWSSDKLFFMPTSSYALIMQALLSRPLYVTQTDTFFNPIAIRMNSTC